MKKEWQELSYEERIKKYQDSINDKSFFDSYNIVYDYVYELLRSTCIMFNHSNEVCYATKTRLSDMNIDRSVDLAQLFFTDFDIKINVKDLIAKKVLVFKEYSDNAIKANGSNFYDKNNEKKNIVYLLHNVDDSVCIVHELMHYLNQPETSRSQTNDFLTETISYTYELIFADYLMNKNCIDESKYIFCRCEKNAVSFAYNMYNIYRFVDFVKQNGKINKEIYDKEYKKGYDLMLKEFDDYALEKSDINEDSWNFMGHLFGIYCFMEYKKDPQFLDKIKKLNNSINDCSFEDGLNMIDIKLNSKSYNEIKDDFIAFDQMSLSLVKESKCKKLVHK
jgi:hypothetical protein